MKTTADQLATGAITFHSSGGPVLDNTLEEIAYRTQVDTFRDGLHVAIHWLETVAKPDETTIRKSIEKVIR
jgi:hypothetical protein